MAVSIIELATELSELTAWQHTPAPLKEEDYVNMILYGIQRLYVDTGRASEYSDSKIVTNEYGLRFDASFLIDEKMYIMLCAQIAFFKKVQQNVNDQFDYTTDALKVSGADKSYGNLKDTLSNLENERRILYYKMVRYTM